MKGVMDDKSGDDFISSAVNVDLSVSRAASLTIIRQSVVTRLSLAT